MVVAVRAQKGGTDSEMWLLSVDPEGDLLGAVRIVEPNTHSIAVQGVVGPLEDGGLLAVGNAYVAGKPINFAVRINSDGKLTWAKSFSAGNAYLHSVTATHDGGFVFAGAVVDNPVRGWLIRTDASGSLVWSNTYRSSNSDSFGSVREAANGDLIVTGDRQSGDQGPRTFVMRLDSVGSVWWSRGFGTGLVTYRSDAIEASKREVAVVATQLVHLAPDDSEAYVAKFDEYGTPVWSRKFTSLGIGGLNSISQRAHEGFNLTGYIRGNGIANASFWVVRLTPDGLVVWQRGLGGTPTRACYASAGFSETDGSILVAGTSYVVDPSKNQITGGQVMALRANEKGETPGSQIPNAESLVPSVTGIPTPTVTFTVTINTQDVSVSDWILQVSEVKSVTVGKP